LRVAVPMTATSKQEPPIPADDPVAEVVADEAAESEAQQAARRGKKPVTASVATVPAATVPAVTVPAVTVPAVTVPAATVPAATVPAAVEPAAVEPAAVEPAAVEPAAKAAKAKPAMQPNNVRKLRQAAMMSKAELARRAGVSPLTIDRVESGCPCRMDTKRKILEALGVKPEAREQVFGPDIDQG